MNITIQQKDARLKLGYMLRGESLIIEGIIDYNVHFNKDGFFIINDVQISNSVRETVRYLWDFNFKYSRRKQSIQYKYWRKHPLDITKYFPVPVHPEIFQKFVARNQAMISGADIEVKSFCRNCAAIYTDCPRDHHPECFQYLDQDKYPEYNYVNPLGHCPKCDSDDGLSIDSCREMAVSVIDCGDCGFRFEGKCPEDVLEKRFKKKFKKNKVSVKAETLGISMFNIKDILVDKRTASSGLYRVDTVDYDKIYIFSNLSGHFFWAPDFFYRLATPEEIEAGHRIDCNEDSTPKMHSHLAPETLKNDDEQALKGGDK